MDDCRYLILKRREREREKARDLEWELEDGKSEEDGEEEDGEGGGGCFSKPYRKLHNEMNILGRYYGGRRLFLP